MAGTLRLLSVSPNPVTSGEGIIRCRLDGSVADHAVSLKIYDPLGRLVAVPFAGTLPAGINAVVWDMAGLGDARVTPGVYLLRLQSTSPIGADVRRLVVIR